MKKKIIIGGACLLVILCVVVAVFVLSLDRSADLPEEGDCVWTAWITKDEGKYGKASVFTRKCLDCGATQSYEAKPCNHLKYEDDGNGFVDITGVSKSCDCGFMYILSSSPDGKQVKIIGDSAFMDNSGIRFVYMEEGIESIDVAAFAGCLQLLSVHLPESVAYIEAQAFFDCNSLYTVNIPSGIAAIKEYTFGACWALRDIEIPKGVTSVDMGAFSICTSLKSISLPESVKALGKNVFSGCTSLESISMPGVEGELKSETFGSCTSLKEFTIPKGVTTILTSAFFNCSSLEKLYIPKTVDILEFEEGDSPFMMCDASKLKVYCEAEAAPENWLEGYDICNYILSDDGKTNTPVRAQFIFGADF